MICTLWLQHNPEHYTQAETLQNIQEAAKTGAFAPISKEAYDDFQAEKHGPHLASGHAGHGSAFFGNGTRTGPWYAQQIGYSLRMHKGKYYATIEQLDDFFYKKAGRF